MAAPAGITVEGDSSGGAAAANATIANFLSGAVASDIVDATLTITNDAPALFPVGDTLVTFTATDDSGNTASATATVSVVDTTPPRLTPPAATTVEGDSTGGAISSHPELVSFLLAAAATDVVDDTVFVANNCPAVFPLGETLVTFTATDDSGNSSTATATVTVIDTTPPNAVAQSITVQLNASGVASITAADVDGGSSDVVGLASLSVSPSQFTIADIGQNTVTLTATDTSGNAATANATVTVLGGFDYGDAPSAGQSGFPGTYPVTLAENGARHVDRGPTLGETRDADLDGVHAITADADDTTGGADEDGASFGTLVAGQNGVVTVDVQGGTGRVAIWIDFDQDGVWDNASEKVHDADLTATIHSLVFPVPLSATRGTTYARVRLGTDPSQVADPTGAASDGEVEDYAIEIEGVRDRIGVLPSRGPGLSFRLDTNGNGSWDGNAGGDLNYAFARFRGWRSDDRPISGDWDGDGYDEIGVFSYSPAFRGFRLDTNGNGRWDGVSEGDIALTFLARNQWRPSDQPVVGDWNGDGVDDLGFYRNGRFYLDANGNGNWDGVAGGDVVHRFGQGGYSPVVGDWDGDGTDEIGAYRNRRFYLDANGNGTWDGTDGGDQLNVFGTVQYQPVVGDWNGDGRDDIGARLGRRFYLDMNGNGVWDGPEGGDFRSEKFGFVMDLPVIGKWAPVEQLLVTPMLPGPRRMSHRCLSNSWCRPSSWRSLPGRPAT